jgi:hypothetical protein
MSWAKPGQSRGLLGALAQLQVLEAKAKPSSHGFELNFDYIFTY